MASIRTEPGWVTRDVIWVSHNSPPFWKLCKVWGKVYRRTGHHDIVSMALPEGLHSRHKNGGLVHLFLRDLQLTPQATEDSLHREGFVPRLCWRNKLQQQSSFACISWVNISSSEAEFSYHKMKWAIRLTQVFQRVDSLYPMV